MQVTVTPRAFAGEPAPRGRPTATALALVLMASLVLPLLSTTAAGAEDAEGGEETHAPESPDSEGPEEIEEAEFEFLDQTLEVSENLWRGANATYPLLLWSEGRRAYQVEEHVDEEGDPSREPDTIAAFDLDTLEPVTEVVDGKRQRVTSAPLEPPLPGEQTHYFPGRAAFALDEDRGWMFLPARTQGTCRQVQTGTIRAACLGGIHVLDLVDDSLEPVEDIDPNPLPFEGIGLDGDPVVESPLLHAMSHTPGLGDGEGKLHLLLEEGPVAAGGSGTNDGRAPQYVAQLDVASGRTDWIETAPGCSSYRSTDSDSRNNAVTERNTIFVGDADSDPAVYVGCYGPSSGTGSVGRLWLDPDDHDAAPIDTESFPGPGETRSILADPDAKRIWFKSLTGDDETWWVFDGGVSNYLGVVGIGEKAGHRVRGDGRTGVVDPTTGRLYVVEAWLEEEAEGGLFVVDGRRVPIPQAAVFRDLPMREMGHFVDDDGNEAYHEVLQNPLIVDPGTEERPRRLFVRPGQDEHSPHWYVIADHRPVADDIVDAGQILEDAVDDPPPSDDVTLGELTRPTFTGTARGYGLRTIMIGGTDSMLLPGPVLSRRDLTRTVAGLANPANVWENVLPNPRDVDVPTSPTWEDGEPVTGIVDNFLNHGLLELLPLPPRPHPTDVVPLLERGGEGDDEGDDDALPEEAYEPFDNNPWDPEEDETGIARWYEGRERAGDNPCGRTPREFGFGLSGTLGSTATLQPGSSTGAAVPGTMDLATRRDLADPIGRCGDNQVGWLGRLPEVAGQSLFGGRTPTVGGEDPDDRPGHNPDLGGAASCHAPQFDDDGQARPSTEDSSGDAQPVGSTFSSAVWCEEDLSTQGESRARFVTAGPVSVVESYSDYDVSRDTETGGLVATAHAYVRGISIVDEVVGPNGETGTSQVNIDLVETRAEAWAEGRSQPSGADDGCDRDRTAGTCLERTIQGITVIDGITGETHRCDDFDQCPGNDQIIAAMSSALGDSWQVKLREPDALLARGAPNGTQAALQKREIDEFADVVMKSDLLKTLPGLEMVRYNDYDGGRGRQIYQFAGVELGTTYTRQCRGVIEGEQCVQPDVELAEVEVTLIDAVDGTPLPDGVFALHRDDESTLGEGLEALPAGRTCTTDAQGRCSFVALEPGAYTLVQAGAPGDYAPTDEQVPLNLGPGTLFEVDVTNVRAVGDVEVTLADLDEQPLQGGVFELYADADADGAIGLDDPQAATCTTDPGGTCRMEGLALDAYVLRQAAAPDGFAPVDDEVAFALDEPGQVAAVSFSNAPAQPAGDEVGDTDGAVDGGQQAAPPQQGSFNGIERTVPMPVHQPVAVQGPLSPQVASDGGSGGPSIIQGLKDAPGDAIRMIRRSPGQAAGFAALALLATAAVNGPVRRRLLTQTTG